MPARAWHALPPRAAQRDRNAPQIGLNLFGGCITTDTSGAVVPRELVEALAASDFGTAGYFANSFNDVPSGTCLASSLLGASHAPPCPPAAQPQA